jgi:site-specific DNA recombinase
MRIAVYARVSTQRQTQMQTIDQQLERLQAHFQTHGWEWRDDLVFRDDGYSGASLKRPGLDRLREQAALGHFDRVLITAPDRLARKFIHQMLLIEELEKSGCLVEFVERPMSQDPHDQLLLQIRGAVAEYERSLIADRMRRGRLQKYRAGTLLPWGPPPYGYRTDPAHPRDPAGVRLEPAEAATVAEMFAYYQRDGHTLRGLAKQLRELGVRGPRGSMHWSDGTIRHILTNPVYTGTVYAGRNHYRPATGRISPLKPVGGGNGSIEQVPPDDWIVVAHIPAIVSQEQFEMIQEKLKHNQSVASRNNTKHQYLLRAMVSCGLCQLACTGRTTDTGHAYYACNGKRPLLQSPRTEKCPSRFLPVGQLDDLVWADLCEVLLHPECLALALQRAQGGQWLPQELQARRENLRKACVSLKHQLERLTEAYLAGVVPLEEYKRRRPELEQRMEGLAAQMRQLEASASKHVELAGIAQSMEEFCRRVSAGLEQASFEQKRYLVELLIDRVVVTNDEVEIRYVIPTSPNSEQTRFCHLRANYFQSQRQKMIADHIFLQGPASDIGLGQLYRIDVRCRRHNGDQLGRGWPHFRWLRLPILPPPRGRTRIVIGIFFQWHTGNLPTKVTNEGDLQGKHLVFLIG